MNQQRRNFLKGVSAYLAGGSLAVKSYANESPGSSDKVMKHWAWTRPNVDTWSEETWRKSIVRAKKAGVDAVLMQCSTNREALFEHPHPLVPTKKDLVEKSAKVCREEGVEFHAWMWTMPCDNPKIVEKHPDWYAVNRLGQPAHTHPAYVPYYKFMDPSHPEVQEFVRGNVKAVAQIPGVDGVHLDYVRMPDVILAKGLQPKYNLVQDSELPEYDYNYSEHARKQFKAKTGIDPLTDIKDHAAHKAWRQFRYDSVTHLVNGKLVPEAKLHKKQITAAVFPNWQSVRQQWHKWNLDAFLPMLYQGFYNRGIDFIEQETRKGIELLEKKVPVYSGVYRPHVSAKQMNQAYQAMKKGGASGLALFSLEDMDEEAWKAFERSRLTV